MRSAIALSVIQVHQKGWPQSQDVEAIRRDFLHSNPQGVEGSLARPKECQGLRWISWKGLLLGSLGLGR